MFTGLVVRKPKSQINKKQRPKMGSIYSSKLLSKQSVILETQNFLKIYENWSASASFE